MGTETGVRAERRRRLRGIARTIVSVALVVGIFVYAIPKIADYSQVWTAISAMTWLELGSLAAATAFNLLTYWWQNMASISGLGLWQAAVNNQTTTSIADTIPGGGYLAVGVGYAMYRSWGFSTEAVALSVAVTGVWNVFMKLGLPIIAVALLANEGQVSAAFVAASLVGVAMLAVSILLFGLVLRYETLAQRIGDAFAIVVSLLRKVVRKPSVGGWGDAVVGFRRRTIDLVGRRWVALTGTTIVSHLALFLVLLLAIRHVGISAREIGTVQVLGVFAFARLVTALPLTPGGLGMIELSYIGGLVLAGRGRADVAPDVFRAQVAAAVLVFRGLTYGIQIPLGGFTYLIWRSRTSWRMADPDVAARGDGPR